MATLFETFMQYPEKLPETSLKRMEQFGKEQTVCDYIAGMTDNYAVDKFTELFVPTGWHIR